MTNEASETTIAPPWPVLNGELLFVFDGGADMKLVCRLFDGDEVKFWRNNRRWRHVGGPYCSPHTIAARIFEYAEEPTVEQMEFMGDYVSDIGSLIDTALDAIKEGVREKLRTIEDFDRKRLVTRCREEMEAEAQSQTFVYLMKHTNGLTKIGRSKNPRCREKTLQAEDPRLRMVFKAEASMWTETRLHSIYEALRVRGEWFALEERHVDWIVSVIGNNLATESVQ